MKPNFLYILRQRLAGKSFLYEFYFKNKKTLDVGCGEGEFSKFGKDNITGVDLNERAINKLKAEGYWAELGDITKLRFQEGEFEAVHCHNVIEHLDIENALKMLKESSRVLKSGGLFILSSEVVTKEFWNTFGHVKPYPPEAILKLLRKESRESFEGLSNLEFISVFYIGNYSKNRLVYFFNFLIAFYLPFRRREYFLVLKKV